MGKGKNFKRRLNFFPSKGRGECRNILGNRSKYRGGRGKFVSVYFLAQGNLWKRIKFLFVGGGPRLKLRPNLTS